MPADAVEEAPVPPPVEVLHPPPAAVTVSFRNGTAVRIGLLTALLTLLLNTIPLPPALAYLRLPGLSFLAGWFAVWTWSRRTRQRPTIRDGARLGWMAGVFTFLMFAGLLTFVVVVAMTPGALDQVKQQIPRDAGAQELLRFLQNPAPGELIAILVAMFLVFTALPTIGGAISARLAGRETH